MTIQQRVMKTACFVSLCGALYGQTAEKGNVAFQYFVMNGNAIQAETLGNSAVAGKPFSATEERHTLQVLADGTKIDKADSDKFYRDYQGRTRIERDGSDGGSTVMISDPVEGFSAELSPADKSARKNRVMVRKMVTSTSGGGGGGRVMTAGSGTMTSAIVTRDDSVGDIDKMALADKLKTELSMQAAKTAVFTAAGGGATAGGFAFTTETLRTGVKEGQTPVSEDLGTQMINGVPAQGTRSTITIPAGQIGNDRDIKVISERWFSPDLQMLIKSSNNDPRFGETTYQLTNVLQGAQDPTLFQIPADFKVNGLK